MSLVKCEIFKSEIDLCVAYKQSSLIQQLSVRGENGIRNHHHHHQLNGFKI